MPSRRGTNPRRITTGRPAEIRSNFGDAASAGIDFAGLLSQLLTEAVGKPIKRERDFDDLVQRLRTYKAEHNLPGAIPDQRTLLNWCNGAVVPHWNLFELVWDYLFRDTPADHPQRVRLKELWQVAEDAKNESSQAKRRASPITPDSTDRKPDESEPGATGWQPDAMAPLQHGAPVLRLHSPPRGSNTPNAFPLKIELSIGEWEDWVEGRYITLALTEASLNAVFKGCQPAENTQIGRQGNPHDYLKWRADVWWIKGPRRLPNQHLDGEPAGDEPLCTLICEGGPNDSVMLTLRSSYRGLAVVPHDHATDANVVKDKVLQALLQKCQQKDPDGFITWGRATLKRKPRDATDG